MNYKVGQKIRLKDWDRVSGAGAKLYADETVTIAEVDSSLGLNGGYWIRPDGGTLFSVWEEEILFLDEDEVEPEETFELGEMVEVRDDGDEDWYIMKYAGMIHSVKDGFGCMSSYDQIRKIEPQEDDVEVFLNGEEIILSEELITLIKRELAG